MDNRELRDSETLSKVRNNNAILKKENMQKLIPKEKEVRSVSYCTF
jgi:hypothetical protein